ncbi:hypothetical protein COU01_03460 [Candidatus Falkowbacteria bacterium CG10_big_fil_rev_8_21_14_0_10_44_15]|uniref:Uncharacterized protein n=1 Tax=Candidatus Falkowbacteria bacterium CG10_big_fil_rev_8_21_14_0_10_44_15 TaxID=1974569 RepID=A0A2H0UZ77_9BACT|nr:MAG: hypothetical protein COU01_03460 [Candidatus Falkowbacteria bacterium CG10_big_fil_rev_8_21_14_0_10_44_15]
MIDVIYTWLVVIITISFVVFVVLPVGIACLQYHNASRLARQRDEEMIAKAAAAGFGLKGGRSRP